MRILSLCFARDGLSWSIPRQRTLRRSQRSVAVSIPPRVHLPLGARGFAVGIAHREEDDASSAPSLSQHPERLSERAGLVVDGADVRSHRFSGSSPHEYEQADEPLFIMGPASFVLRQAGLVVVTGLRSTSSLAEGDDASILLLASAAERTPDKRLVVGNDDDPRIRDGAHEPLVVESDGDALFRAFRIPADSGAALLRSDSEPPVSRVDAGSDFARFFFAARQSGYFQPPYELAILN
ncbi:hypothetical protein K438DRAFT_1968084 [Mycena galopus ATCC 62051]|nr:hypothetical protein K438DRAFT_1968084 [Mycena galopus ATCC 62051]